MASKKKPSAAQLRARAKFSKIMKSGGFGKRRKSSKKRIVRGKTTKAGRPRKSIVRPRTTRRSRGGSVSDVNKSLLLDDISKLSLGTAMKNKITSIIAKNLKI